MKELDLAIIKTLAYADLFGQALTVEELHKYLLEHRIDRGEFQNRLFERHSSKVEVRDDLVYLSGSRLNVDHKPQQRLTTYYKLQMAKRYSRLFKLVPWVKLVCVTGSVAGGTPTVDDDIDVLVVSSAGRLWITRLVVTGLVWLTGKRRAPADDPHRVNNKLCLNMWLSEDHLATADQNLYVANELAHMVPMVNRDATYERYIVANEWVNNELPNFFDSVTRQFIEGNSPVPGSQSFRIKSGMTSSIPLTPYHLLTWLDSMLEKWQRRRMRRVTRETVEDDLLMFHPRDYGCELLAKYHDRLKSLGVN